MGKAGCAVDAEAIIGVGGIGGWREGVGRATSDCPRGVRSRLRLRGELCERRDVVLVGWLGWWERAEARVVGGGASLGSARDFFAFSSLQVLL